MISVQLIAHWLEVSKHQNKHTRKLIFKSWEQNPCVTGRKCNCLIQMETIFCFPLPISFTCCKCLATDFWITTHRFGRVAISATGIINYLMTSKHSSVVNSYWTYKLRIFNLASGWNLHQFLHAFFHNIANRSWSHMVHLKGPWGKQVRCQRCKLTKLRFGFLCVSQLFWHWIGKQFEVALLELWSPSLYIISNHLCIHIINVYPN